MAWARLQSVSGTNAGSGNAAATFTTANLTAGSKVIAVVAVSCSSGSFIVTSVKDGALNTWTQLATKISADFGTHLGLYALDTPAGDAGTKPTITATIGTNFGAKILLQEVTGLVAGNTSAMLDGTAATATGTTSPATTGAYSSAAASEYLVACYGDPGLGISLTTPAGYTADANNVTGDNLAECAVFYKNSGNGAESASVTMSGAGTWDTILVAFQLVAGGIPAGLASGTGTAQPVTMTSNIMTSGPRYATATSDLGGVYGAWATPQYAQGGP